MLYQNPYLTKLDLSFTIFYGSPNSLPLLIILLLFLMKRKRVRKEM